MLKWMRMKESAKRRRTTSQKTSCQYGSLNACGHPEGDRLIAEAEKKIEAEEAKVEEEMEVDLNPEKKN